MKINKLLALTTAMVFAFTANANIKQNIDIEENKKIPKATFTPSQAEFGVYKVEASLQAVPSAVAAPDHVVAIIGSMSVINIATDQKTQIIGEGTIVRNILTNELTRLTGHVTVLLGKDASATDIATKVGMKVISVFPGTDIAVLKINEGNDLLKSFKSLKALGIVIESKIEVADTIYKAE